MDEAQHPWFAVRCVIRFANGVGNGGAAVYEERITLWRAASFSEAIERAESEAREYATDLDAECIDLAQAFHLFVNEDVNDGAEVFSLMRTSDLPADEYVDRFFDTGDERQSPSHE